MIEPMLSVSQCIDLMAPMSDAHRAELMERAVTTVLAGILAGRPLVPGSPEWWATSCITYERMLRDAARPSTGEGG